MAKKRTAHKAPRGGTYIGLTDGEREAVARRLGVILADEVLLYIKTRNFHWNVVGKDFSELHKFFEAQYEALDEVFDDVAERMRALGERAPGSMAEFQALARLSEKSGAATAASDMLGALLDDHETLIRALRNDIVAIGKTADVGTEDFLTGLLENHEKMAWMLRAYHG